MAYKDKKNSVTQDSEGSLNLNCSRPKIFEPLSKVTAFYYHFGKHFRERVARAEPENYPKFKHLDLL